MNPLAVLKSKPSKAHAKLRILNGEEKGRSFRLISDYATIGRSGGENDIALNDPYCSRRHAIIVKDESSKAFVVQRVSKNALLKVNNKNISKGKELKNKDILTVGQTQMKFEILKEGKLTAVPHPANYPAYPSSRPATSRQKNPPAGKNPMLIRIIFALIIGLLLYIGLGDQTPNQEEKEAIRIRTQKDIESDIKAIEDMKSEVVKEKKIMKDRAHKNAHIAYLRGIRDYRQGLFGRARENFRVCKTLYPKHKLCPGYLKKSQIKYEKLAQKNMVLGKQYRDQNQFRQCAFSFKTVMVMMSYNQSHPLYNEAKTNFNFCQMQMEEIY